MDGSKRGRNERRNRPAIIVASCVVASACHAYDHDQYQQLIDGATSDTANVDSNDVANTLDAADATDAMALPDAMDALNPIDVAHDIPDVATIQTDAMDVIVAVDAAPDAGCGPNIVLNGGYESGLLGWNTFVDSTVMATIAPSAMTPFAGSDSAQIHVTAAAADSWHVQISQAPLMFTGHRLHLVFSVRGDPGRSIEVGFQHGTTPFTGYGSNIVPVTSAWVRHTYDIVTPADDMGQIFFFLGDSVGDTFVDEVSVSICP